MPERIKISRSLKKSLRNRPFRITFDQAFGDVINACSAPRKEAEGTWITDEMKDAYNHLNHLGHAHSVEVWHQDKLVGGLYGIAIGQVFFGESMFSRVSDSSKIALVHLAMRLMEWGYKMIDCQLHSTHLVSLGAEEISRKQFCQRLDKWCNLPGKNGTWSEIA